VQSIRQANGMSAQATALKPGQRIRIPGNSKNRPAPAASARTGASPGASPAASDRATASPSASHHVVRAGETIYGIAGSLGVSAQELCDLNNLNRSKPIIRPGMRLLIPGKTGPGAAAKPASAPTAAAPAPGKPAPAQAPAPDSGQEKAPAKGRVVIVKAGVTLSGRARAHKVSLNALRSANRLDKDAKLKLGQKLVLP
jgi:LysM repeat protein